MPTLDFITGLNHRVPLTGSGSWSSQTGESNSLNAQINTSVVRRTGGTSVFISQGPTVWGKTTVTASATWVMVVYVNFAVLPSSSCFIASLECNNFGFPS